jgi:hypothetical protein
VFVIGEQILAGRSRQLQQLLADILYAALVPYLDPAEALRRARPTPRRSLMARRSMNLVLMHRSPG